MGQGVNKKVFTTDRISTASTNTIIQWSDITTEAAVKMFNLSLS